MCLGTARAGPRLQNPTSTLAFGAQHVNNGDRGSSKLCDGLTIASDTVQSRHTAQLLGTSFGDAQTGPALFATVSR